LTLPTFHCMRRSPALFVEANHAGFSSSLQRIIFRRLALLDDPKAGACDAGTDDFA
jgi:hypothetical protein